MATKREPLGTSRRVVPGSTVRIRGGAPHVAPIGTVLQVGPKELLVLWSTGDRGRVARSDVRLVEKRSNPGDVIPFPTARARARAAAPRLSGSNREFLEGLAELAARNTAYRRVLDTLPGNVGQIVAMHLNKGETLPLEAHHQGEQVLLVVQGLFQVTVNGETHRLVPGATLTVPQYARHEARVFSGPVKLLTIYRGFAPHAPGLVQPRQKSPRSAMPANENPGRRGNPAKRRGPFEYVGGGCGVGGRRFPCDDQWEDRRTGQVVTAHSTHAAHHHGEGNPETVFRGLSSISRISGPEDLRGIPGVRSVVVRGPGGRPCASRGARRPNPQDWTQFCARRGHRGLHAYAGETSLGVVRCRQTGASVRLMPRKPNPFSPRGGPQQLLEQRHGYQLARATLAARGDARGAALADWRLQRLEGELDAFRATYRSLMGNAAEAFERLHEVSCPGVRNCPHAHRALWEVTQDRSAAHANPALPRPRDTSKHAPGSMVLQTIIVSHAAARDGREARAIARRIARHDPGPAERTSQSWRFRQRNPEDFQRGTFRTLRLWPGVALVVGKLRRGAPR